MLIIHPKDPTTEFLKILYPPEPNVILEKPGEEEIVDALLINTRIMILGHGTELGLIDPQDYCHFIIGPRHARFLQGKTVIGIWCNANIYAGKFGLTGLFSGMIISEQEEAFMFGISVNRGLIIYEREKWAEDLHDALLGGLDMVPQKMKERPQQTELRKFNYNSLYYLENGEE